MPPNMLDQASISGPAAAQQPPAMAEQIVQNAIPGAPPPGLTGGGAMAFPGMPPPGSAMPGMPPGSIPLPPMDPGFMQYMALAQMGMGMAPGLPGFQIPSPKPS